MARRFRLFVTGYDQITQMLNRKTARTPLKREVLRERLDQLVGTFDVSTIEPDPLQLVRRYGGPLDQEVAGLIAAAFAYGRADVIVREIGALLDAMQPSPFRYVARLDRAEARRRFAGFAYRFHKTADLVSLLERLCAVIRKHGSLGELFRSCYDDRDDDIGPSLTRFVEAILTSHQSPATSNLHYLLTSPNDKSACKRMNLFLRWMVRRTSPDLGLWTFVDPAKLVMPLDTHVHRIATFLGLSRRKRADWKTARALTDRLATFDAADPVRYDFALCRLGILDLCSRRRRKEQCDVCLLRDVCRFPMT
jgi:uncharacterized protein (TIGR02757 family)